MRVGGQGGRGCWQRQNGGVCQRYAPTTTALPDTHSAAVLGSQQAGRRALTHHLTARPEMSPDASSSWVSTTSLTCFSVVGESKRKLSLASSLARSEVAMYLCKGSEGGGSQAGR